jgi:hypothetical protein
LAVLPVGLGTLFSHLHPYWLSAPRILANEVREALIWGEKTVRKAGEKIFFLLPAKFRVRTEASNFTEDVIMSCLVRVIAHFKVLCWVSMEQ